MSGPHIEDEVFGMGEGLHHVLPADVMATVVAHCDRGDGYCGGPHDGTPPLYPCNTRLWHETKLSELNRRRPS